MREKTIGATLVAAAVAGAIVLAMGMETGSAQSMRRDGGEGRVIQQLEPLIEKTFPFAVGATVGVDNVTGPIHVIGDSGTTVRMNARETIAADDSAALARARRDVHLDYKQDGGGVSIYVDGPFRCQDSDAGCDGWRDDNGQRHWSDPGYNVKFDFELHVPAAAALALATVNDGGINVEAVNGNFHVSNVNGAIDLEEMAGAGTARGVNGPVKVGYRANPRGDCVFATVNGTVNLYFQPGLNADFQYKTLNGGVFTDFATTPLPPAATAVEAGNGRRVYRGGQYTGARVGNGGARITLDGLNGNLYIHRR